MAIGWVLKPNNQNWFIVDDDVVIGEVEAKNGSAGQYWLLRFHKGAYKKFDCTITNWEYAHGYIRGLERAIKSGVTG